MKTVGDFIAGSRCKSGCCYVRFGLNETWQYPSIDDVQMLRTPFHEVILGSSHVLDFKDWYGAKFNLTMANALRIRESIIGPMGLVRYDSDHRVIYNETGVIYNETDIPWRGVMFFREETDAIIARILVTDENAG